MSNNYVTHIKILKKLVFLIICLLIHWCVIIVCHLNGYGMNKHDMKQLRFPITQSRRFRIDLTHISSFFYILGIRKSFRDYTRPQPLNVEQFLRFTDQSEVCTPCWHYCSILICSVIHAYFIGIPETHFSAIVEASRDEIFRWQRQLQGNTANYRPSGKTTVLIVYYCIVVFDVVYGSGGSN